MEIPTEEIIKRLRQDYSDRMFHNAVVITTATALEVIEVIKAQALEIRELQAGICRLREEMQKMEKIA